METVYKVTGQSLEKHISIFAQGRLKVEYIPGEVTKPNIKGTYLLAFDTLTHARLFVRDNITDTTFTIWEARAIVKGRVRLLHSPNALPREFMSFWQKDTWKGDTQYNPPLQDGVPPWHTFGAPSGTVACSKITLVAPMPYEMEDNF